MKWLFSTLYSSPGLKSCSQKVPLLFAFALALALTPACAQNLWRDLKENAVNIHRLDSLPDEVYDLVSDYRLVMIGEMHGTSEPAKFVTGLAELFTRKGDSVNVGFEIPSAQMNEFLTEHTDSSISRSAFFSSSIDGRASVAWAETISTLNKNPRARIFFFDTNSDYTSQRDSEMYLNIKKEMLVHPGWKTITISGNIHNMLLPYKGENKTGFLLSIDHELNISEKICSLNHYYQSGTVFNRMNEKLQEREVNDPSKYSTTVDYDNYIFLFPVLFADNYTGIFFTRKVSASKPLSYK